MSSPAVFAKRMRVLGETVERQSGKLIGKIVTAIVNDVVPATPIKTGKAQRNWQTNIGSAASTTLGAPIASGAGAVEAIARAKAVASLVQSGDAVVHITNNVPYIQKLNDGSSAQAASLFVQTAIVRAISSVSGFKITTSSR